MYLYFDKQLLNFKSSNEDLLSYLLLDKDLSLCFYNAQNIETSLNKISFEFYDTTINEYSFKNDSIYRINGDDKFYTGLRSNGVEIQTEQNGPYTLTKVKIHLIIDDKTFSRTYLHKKRKMKINKK